MKNGRFEVGDPIECVDVSDLFGSDFLKKGEKYTIRNLITCKSEEYLYVEDNNGGLGGGFSYRFKLVEPDTPEDFTYEYFSVLNEKDAKKYIGKIMEFADGKSIREDNWVKGIFKKYNIPDNCNTDYPFVSGKSEVFQFMRTCPETFQEKKVKKTFERWVNIYLNDSLGMGIHKTRECADYHAGSNRIDCIHIYKEYEVGE